MTEGNIRVLIAKHGYFLQSFILRQKYNFHKAKKLYYMP